MSRLLSYFLEFINIITAILVVMSIAALVALVVGEPVRSEGLIFAVLVILIVLAAMNGFIALLVTTRRHLVQLRNDKIRQTELLADIVRLSGAAEVKAAKRQDMKYPPTNL